MKKTLIFLIIILLNSCKNENIKALLQIKPIAIKEKGSTNKKVDNLPFGNIEVTKYPFKKEIWYDDYDDKSLQKITKTIDLESDSIRLLKVKFNMKIGIPKKEYNYYTLKDEKIKRIDDSKIIDVFYLLNKNDIFSIYYVGATVFDIENKLFENKYSWYIITLDKNNHLIDFIKFYNVEYSKEEYSDRWNFCNKRISYIDKHKIISVYNFICKEWDISYEYKLESMYKYQITESGKIVKI